MTTMHMVFYAIFATLILLVATAVMLITWLVWWLT